MGCRIRGSLARITFSLLAAVGNPTQEEGRRCSIRGGRPSSCESLPQRRSKLLRCQVDSLLLGHQSPTFTRREAANVCKTVRCETEDTVVFSTKSFTAIRQPVANAHTIFVGELGGGVGQKHQPIYSTDFSTGYVYICTTHRSRSNATKTSRDSRLGVVTFGACCTPS